MSIPEFGIDISDRRQAKQRRSMDELFQALIENALDIITIIDAEGIIRYESPSVERVLGYKPAELIGLNLAELLHPDDASKATRFLKAIKSPAPEGETPIGQVMEVRFRHQDGSWRILESVARVLDTPSVTGIVINSRDITERKQAEETVRRQHEHFKTVIENIFKFVPESIVVFTAKLNLFKQNKAFDDLLLKYAAKLGYTEQELSEIIIAQIKQRIAEGEDKEIKIAKKRQ
jgi:PAS domain S-box-containing protein